MILFGRVEFRIEVEAHHHQQYCGQEHIEPRIIASLEIELLSDTYSCERSVNVVPVTPAVPSNVDRWRTGVEEAEVGNLAWTRRSTSRCMKSVPLRSRMQCKRCTRASGG